MKLDAAVWKSFRLSDLFPQIYKSTAYNRDELTPVRRKNAMSIRYITRTGENNGCEFLAQNDFGEDVEAGNAITIGDTTATCFYQPEPFITGDHMVILRSDWLNEKRGLFLITLLKREKIKYSYGRAFVMRKISDTTILLPVKSQSETPLFDQTHGYGADGWVPDWEFIENFVTSLRYQPLTTMNTGISNMSLQTASWEYFPLGDLFSIEKGKRLTKADMIEGSDNYLGAIDNNNGIRQKIAADRLWNANCITVNYNGSVGEAFYQSEPFWASDDVNVLYPKGWKMNPFIGLFLATVIKTERPRFSYGRKWTKESMKQTKIKLPAKDGLPDFEYMEQYMRSLPYSDRIQNVNGN